MDKQDRDKLAEWLTDNTYWNPPPLSALPVVSAEALTKFLNSFRETHNCAKNSDGSNCKICGRHWTDSLMLKQAEQLMKED